MKIKYCERGLTGLEGLAWVHLTRKSVEGSVESIVLTHYNSRMRGIESQRQVVNTREGRGNPAPSAKYSGPGSRLVGPLGTKFSTYDDILTN